MMQNDRKIRKDMRKKADLRSLWIHKKTAFSEQKPSCNMRQAFLEIEMDIENKSVFYIAIYFSVRNSNAIIHKCMYRSM